MSLAVTAYEDWRLGTRSTRTLVWFRAESLLALLPLVTLPSAIGMASRCCSVCCCHARVSRRVLLLHTTARCGPWRTSAEGKGSTSSFDQRSCLTSIVMFDQ